MTDEYWEITEAMVWKAIATENLIRLTNDSGVELFLIACKKEPTLEQIRNATK